MSSPESSSSIAPTPSQAAGSAVDDELAWMDAYIAKLSRSKRESMRFLQRAGILDASGELAEPYRD